MPSGSIIQHYFYTKEEPTVIFDTFLEEMTKFQDPIIIPESQTFRMIATYYKIKPTVGQSGRAKSPMKRQLSGSGKVNPDELSNKIVEISFNITKITKSISFCAFNREDVSFNNYT